MTDKPLPITGGCLCGAVRYEACEPPQSASICHCRMCQKLNGGPFAVGVHFRKAAFRFTRGAPQLYRSSDIAERGFCTVCGSRLIYRPLGGPLMVIEAGSLDQPEYVSPEYHTGVEHWVPWLSLDDGLPRLRTDENATFRAFKAATDQSED